MFIRCLNILLFVLFSGFALGQDSYNYDDFNVTDGDLETFDDDGIDNNRNAGVQDFPSSKEEDFNYGGVENFSDEEQNFDEGEQGLIDFGDEEPVGKKIDKPVKNKTKNAAGVKKSSEDIISPPSASTSTPTLSNSLNSGSELFPVDQNSLQPEPSANTNISTPIESPYAPLP